MRTICQKHFEENCKICHPEIYDMKNLNELYNKIDTWYKKQDPKLLKKFLHSGTYSYQRDKFMDVVYWYEDIQDWKPESREYFLGKKEITLEIIQNLFREFMRPADIPRNENELIDLAIGNFDDDMNIYQVEDDLRSSGSLPMIFSFLYYKKDWDKDIYDDKLYNSLQYTEELQDMFEFVDYEMPSDKEIEKIIEKELKSGNNKLENDFKYKVEDIIREFQYKEGFEDRINTLKQLITE